MTKVLVSARCRCSRTFSFGSNLIMRSTRFFASSTYLRMWTMQANRERTRSKETGRKRGSEQSLLRCAYVPNTKLRQSRTDRVKPRNGGPVNELLLYLETR